jgi:hypothetical protein
MEAIRIATACGQRRKLMGVADLSRSKCASHRTATSNVGTRAPGFVAHREPLRIFETNHEFGRFDGNGIEIATKMFRQMFLRSVFIAKEICLGLMLAVLAARRTTVSVF